MLGAPISPISVGYLLKVRVAMTFYGECQFFFVLLIKYSISKPMTCILGTLNSPIIVSGKLA